MPEPYSRPTQETILALIPIGRRPYVIAAAEIGRPEVTTPNPLGRPQDARVSIFGLRKAIISLATGDRDLSLDPPLPRRLGEIIGEMSDRASATDEASSRPDGGASIFTNPEYRNAAEMAVRAALDHGYSIFIPDYTKLDG